MNEAIAAPHEGKIEFIESELSGTAVDPEYEKTDGKSGD